MTSVVEKVCRDARDGFPVQVERWMHRSLNHPNHTYNNSCLTRPFKASTGGEDHSSVNANPPESCGACVSLINRFSGDESEASVWSKQVETATEEMSDQV